MLRTLVVIMAIALVLPLAGCDDETKTEECTAAEEVCDGVDNDCDGVVDNGFECVPGDSRACGSMEGACEVGSEACGDTCLWSGVCEGGIAPADEVCDAAEQDENCDGSANEGCDCNEGETQECCGADPVVCVDGAFLQCPAPPVETCNLIDDDCDGTVDNGLAASIDAHEPNDSCALARALPLLLAGETISITGTSYRVDGGDDVDYYLVSAPEGETMCFPGDTECYSVLFTVTDPAGGDVAFDVVASDCSDASPGDPGNLHSTDEAPENELRVDWAGTCGIQDDMTFFVIVYPGTGGGVCGEYELSVSRPAEATCE